MDTRYLEETLILFMQTRTELDDVKKRIAALRENLLHEQRDKLKLEFELGNLRTLLEEIENDLQTIKKQSGEK